MSQPARPETDAEWAAHWAFYQLAITERDAAWAELEQLKGRTSAAIALADALSRDDVQVSVRHRGGPPVLIGTLLSAYLATLKGRPMKALPPDDDTSWLCVGCRARIKAYRRKDYLCNECRKRSAAGPYRTPGVARETKPPIRITDDGLDLGGRTMREAFEDGSWAELAKQLRRPPSLAEVFIGLCGTLLQHYGYAPVAVTLPEPLFFALTSEIHQHVRYTNKLVVDHVARSLSLATPAGTLLIQKQSTLCGKPVRVLRGEQELVGECSLRDGHESPCGFMVSASSDSGEGS